MPDNCLTNSLIASFAALFVFTVFVFATSLPYGYQELILRTGPGSLQVVHTVFCRLSNRKAPFVSFYFSLWYEADQLVAQSQEFVNDGFKSRLAIGSRRFRSEKGGFCLALRQKELVGPGFRFLLVLHSRGFPESVVRLNGPV